MAKTRRMSKRVIGLCIAGSGTLVVTPDAALLRVQQLAGGSPQVITIWRYAVAGAISTGVAAYGLGGFAPMCIVLRSSPRLVACGSLMMVFINYGFTLSLLFVDTAKALLLISLSPLWAALLGYVILGDKLRLRTIIAQLLSLAAIALMLVPDLLPLLTIPDRDGDSSSSHPSSDAHAERGSSSELLSLVPLATGICQAALLILSRMHNTSPAMEIVPAVSGDTALLFAACSMLHDACFLCCMLLAAAADCWLLLLTACRRCCY